MAWWRLTRNDGVAKQSTAEGYLMSVAAGVRRGKKYEGMGGVKYNVGGGIFENDGVAAGDTVAAACWPSVVFRGARPARLGQRQMASVNEEHSIKLMICGKTNNSCEAGKRPDG